MVVTRDGCSGIFRSPTFSSALRAPSPRQIMNLPALLLLATSILAANAGAATWVEIGGSDAVVVSVDTESLRRDGTKVRSWLKWQWSKPVDVPNLYPVKLYQLERQLQVSDCKNGTFAIAQGVRYADETGNDVVDSYTVPEKAWQFSEAAPETIGESIVKYVCKVTVRTRK